MIMTLESPILRTRVPYDPYVFYDILERKNAFLGFKKKRCKKSKS